MALAFVKNFSKNILLISQTIFARLSDSEKNDLSDNTDKRKSDIFRQNLTKHDVFRPLRKMTEFARMPRDANRCAILRT